MSKYFKSIEEDFNAEFGQGRSYISEYEISNANKFGNISTQQAFEILRSLEKEHDNDIIKMGQLKSENNKLMTQIKMFEKTNERTVQLSQSIDRLTNKYLRNEQIRTQQVAEIQQLVQEVERLKRMIMV